MDAVRKHFNPVNHGYGGSQRTGYDYAIENGFDFVALLDGDGQYAPEGLTQLLRPLTEDGATDAFGSRMITPNGAIKGDMPRYIGAHADRRLSASKPYTGRPDV